MNLKLFTVAIMVSALPLLALAEEAGISLNKGDFISAKKISRDGEVLVGMKLSKSGKSKFRKLNEHFRNQFVHSDIVGVVSDFKLRDKIKGEDLQMGPFSESDASKILSAFKK